MTMHATPTAVRQELVVNAPIERAFNVFTEGYHTWNPPEHHIGEVELDHTIMEQREGGRWYEVGVDGSQCDWGRVLAWEPPHRLVYLWHLRFDRADATEVEVTFAPHPDGTLVRIEHRGWERLGTAAEERRDRNRRGWAGVTEHYRRAAAADQAPA